VGWVVRPSRPYVCESNFTRTPTGLLGCGEIVFLGKQGRAGVPRPPAREPAIDPPGHPPSPGRAGVSPACTQHPCCIRPRQPGCETGPGPDSRPSASQTAVRSVQFVYPWPRTGSEPGTLGDRAPPTGVGQRQPNFFRNPGT